MAESRVIRKSFIDSDRVNGLGWFAECVYHRLLLVADDYGLYDARPAYLRSQLFGMKLEAVREADLQRALTEVERAGLVRFYTVDGKPYMWLVNYGQRVQSKGHYPFPDDPDFCRVYGGSRCFTVGHGEPPLRSRGEVEVVVEDGGGGEVSACAPATHAATSAATPTPTSDDLQLLASETFGLWLDSLRDAVPQLARVRQLPADSRAAAADAYRALPDAGGLKVQTMLKRYYAARKDTVAKYGVRDYRPKGVRSFFRGLHDIAEYAQEFCEAEDARLRRVAKARRESEAVSAQLGRGAPEPGDDEPMSQEELHNAFKDALS